MSFSTLKDLLTSLDRLRTTEDGQRLSWRDGALFSDWVLSWGWSTKPECLQSSPRDTRGWPAASALFRWGAVRHLAHRNRSDFCDLRLRCPSRTPEIARFPRQEKAMLHCDLRVRWKVASDLRFRAAISEPKTPSFCGMSGDFPPSTRKSLAIAIVRFWCAKVRHEDLSTGATDLSLLLPEECKTVFDTALDFIYGNDLPHLEPDHAALLFKVAPLSKHWVLGRAWPQLMALTWEVDMLPNTQKQKELCVTQEWLRGPTPEWPWLTQKWLKNGVKSHLWANFRLLWESFCPELRSSLFEGSLLFLCFCAVYEHVHFTRLSTKVFGTSGTRDEQVFVHSVPQTGFQISEIRQGVDVSIFRGPSGWPLTTEMLQKILYFEGQSPKSWGATFRASQPLSLVFGARLSWSPTCPWKYVASRASKVKAGLKKISQILKSTWKVCPCSWQWLKMLQPTTVEADPRCVPNGRRPSQADHWCDSLWAHPHPLYIGRLRRKDIAQTSRLLG